MDPVGSSVHVRGVGRARELATIAFARDSARTGHGSLVVATGEPGIGKTWLCEGALDAARREGFATGWGTGWPTGAAPPLWPWHQALRELCGPEVVALLDVLPADAEDPTWFLRAVDLVDELRRRTADRPSMVVIDDLHAADVASVQLARFLARHARSLHLLVVVAHRGPVADAASGPADPLAGLDHEATQLPLVGLARDEVAAILRTDGRVELDDADLSFLLRATGGRPADVERLAAVAAEPRDGTDPRTSILRALVGPRVAALDPATRRAAACAALVARTVSWSELAGVSAPDDPSPAVVAAALQDLDLAVAVGPTELSFAHDQVVRALTDGLTPAEAIEAHARAAAFLAAGSTSAIERRARRAHHALESATRSPEDARTAVDAAADAARALAAANHHDRAADLLGRATAVHEREGLGPAPAPLLAAHATAVLRSGRLAESRVLFEEAARAADEAGDPTSLATAALGLGGIWLSEHRSTLDHGRILDLQRRALRGLPEHDVALRCRLRVRLAAEEAYAFGPDEALADALDAALDEARALGDPLVLAESLSLYHHVLLGPDELGERQAVARGIIDAATAGGDALLSLVGLCWLTVDQFLVGDRAAERSLRELHARADAIGCRSIGFVADVMDVMLLIRAGRLEEAERRAGACFEQGTEVGDADALAWYGTHLVVIRWLQGRSREVLDLASETGTSPTLTRTNNAFVAIVAHLAAESGEADQARVAISQLRTGGLERIRHSSVWLAMLASTVEAAAIVGDTAALREAGALLAPFAHLPMLGSMAIVCMGSVHRPLGLVALGTGDPEQAVLEFEAAVAEDDRLGNRPLAALCRADLARALVARGRPGDEAAAADALDHAIRDAGTLGLTSRADTWRSRRLALDDTPRTRSGGPRPTGGAGATTARLDAGTGTIRRLGSSWILATATAEVVTPDLLGMTYLVELLRRPGREIATVDLAGGAAVGTATGPSDLWGHDQPVLDDQALAAYRARITDLESDLDEADRFADPERSARARAELDELVEELGRSTRLHGRARAFDSQAERARTAVRKALRRALDHIESVDPDLGAALRRSIQTGRSCCYRPGPGAPTRWIED